MTKSTPTLTLTQSGLLAVLLRNQRDAVIRLARRHAHRKHPRAAFWSALTWLRRVLTAPRPDSAKPLVGTASHLNLSPRPIAGASQIRIYTKLWQQNHRDPPLWTRDVIVLRLPFLFTHARQLAAIVALGCLVIGLWFGVSTRHASRPIYPYFNTQKLVPPWNEPTPLEGNGDRGGKHR